MLPNKIKALILDMDGVLWRGDEPVDGLVEAFELIQSRKLQFRLLTNNSTRTPGQYSEKLRKFGLHIDEDFILTSSQAVAHMLAEQFPAGGAVYIVGEEGLRAALKEAGFSQGENPIAVVAGMDRELTYASLVKATSWIRRGVPFFGTNPDKTFPTPQGLVPGAGATLAFIETSTKIKPIIAGKPEKYMFDMALKAMQVLPGETISVGDRFETDILGGQNAGCCTALVLSGVTSHIDVINSKIKADFIAANLLELVQ